MIAVKFIPGSSDADSGVDDPRVRGVDLDIADRGAVGKFLEGREAVPFGDPVPSAVDRLEDAAPGSRIQHDRVLRVVGDILNVDVGQAVVKDLPTRSVIDAAVDSTDVAADVDGFFGVVDDGDRGEPAAAAGSDRGPGDLGERVRRKQRRRHEGK